MQSRPGSERITFASGNALTDQLPGKYDTIIFKSMLHDWPEKEASLFLSKAAEALEPGGRILVFERWAVEEGKTKLTYSLLPMLLFYHSFRSPIVYEGILRGLGFDGIEITSIDLEMPFFLLKATKNIG